MLLSLGFLLLTMVTILGKLQAATRTEQDDVCETNPGSPHAHRVSGTGSGLKLRDVGSRQRVPFDSCVVVRLNSRTTGFF